MLQGKAACLREGVGGCESEFTFYPMGSASSQSVLHVSTDITGAVKRQAPRDLRLYLFHSLVYPQSWHLVHSRKTIAGVEGVRGGTRKSRWKYP